MRRCPFALVLALTTLLAVPAARAAEDKPVPTAEEAAKDEGPVKVKVGIYLLNVGKYELATGTFTVDFYLSLRSDKDMGDQRFEFMNGRGSIDKITDTKTEKFYRVQGNLMTNVDLRKFPWDSHVLPIVIEHATRTAKEVVYEPDQEQTGIDAEVRLVGWDLKRFATTAKLHEYPVYKESYSQYTYQLEVGRVILASSLKTFLPVFVFVIVTLVSLLIGVEKADSRITMNTALLIAAVMFHLSIQGSLPPVGYLTLADKVMIATYAVIGTNLGLAVMLLRLMMMKAEPAAQALRRRAFVGVPLIALASYLVAFVSW
ncbi:MAG: hypothetical protein QM765_20485 [Myxococcales bacterium]